ncbi:MAG: sigma-54 dependent transcriptional regulator [Candidatus Sulfobium sp.]|jgi:DNA-binding NtrC family response regulator
MNFRILIAEDEDITRKHLLYALKREGYETVGVSNGREALDYIEKERFDVLITDIRMPEMSGIELLEKVREKYYGVEVMIITGYGSIDSAVDAMKKGAYEYITKPFNLDELLAKVKNIHERSVLKRENVAFRNFYGMNRGTSVVARSQAMRNIIETVEHMSDSDCNVFLGGERGVGKGLIAKMIHFTSRRRNLPFISLNCSTIPPHLLAEELFGAETGAGTAGFKVRQGLVEVANSGSLFLDEISALPPGVQTGLLRTIEDGEFLRTGGVKPVKVDVRFITSSARDVKKAAGNAFLEDLFYKLNVMEVFVAPLRERREDIEPLSIFFLQRHCGKSCKQINGFTKESIDILLNYSYPGNARELSNIIERSVILETGDVITPSSLPRSIRMFRIDTFQPDRVLTLEELTREYAEKILITVEGDKARAASLLGITEIDLRRMLKKK